MVGLSLGLGLGLSASTAIGVSTVSYTFSSVSALGETNAKTGTTSSLRDSSGNWQAVPTTTVRYHKSEDLDEMCLLNEDAVTNLITCQKYNITATTNLTKGGDAASTLTVANDATTIAGIAASELVDLNTNDNLFLLDNTSGVAAAFVDFGGTTGSVSPSSQSLFVMGGASGNYGNLGLYDSVGVAANATQTTLNGTALIRIRQDAVTPDATTDNMRLVVDAGKKAYFTVPQMEIYRHCTTPVISTSTGTVARNVDNISAVLPFDMDIKGGWAANVYVRDIGTAVQGLFSVTDAAGGSANSMGMRTLSTRPMLEAQMVTNSGDDSTEDIAGIIPTRKNWTGMYWDAAEGTGVAPNLRFERVTRDAFSASLTEIWFGKDKQFGSNGTVEIFELSLMTGAVTLNNLADVMIPTDAIAITVENSQSNGRVFGRDQTSGSNKNLGEQAVVAALKVLYPSSTPFWVDGAKAGSSMYKVASDPNRWLEPENSDANGFLAEKFIEQAAAFSRKGRFVMRLSNIGETDAGSLNLATDKLYRNTIRTNIDVGVPDLAAVPYAYMPRSNRSTPVDDYNIWRESERQLAVEVANTYVAPETANIDMDPASSNLHLSSDGSVAYAQYIANLAAFLDGETITGGALGADVIYIERDTADIYTSYEYDGDATDFVPTTLIQGHVFLDDDIEQTINAQTQENTFTTKITLAGAPSGVEELWYGFGSLDYVTDFTKIIVDNDTNALPLKFYNETLPYAKYNPDTFSGLLIWQDSTIDTTVGQRDDLTVNGYDAIQGTVGQQPTIVANDQFNKSSLSFLDDGTNDRMDIASQAALAALEDEITMEFIWKGTPSTAFRNLMDWISGNGIRLSNDASGAAAKLVIRVATSAGSQVITTRPTGIFDGSIHHIVLRVNTGVVDCWVDGVQQVSGDTYTVGTNGFKTSANIRIQDRTEMNDFFLAVYDNALSDADIANKYLHYKARLQVT